MALTTTQVNAAYVALLGRAAEGNANAWAANSADTKTLANAILSVDSKFENNPEQAKTNEDFVDALYQQVLGRTADADGKAFWASALANGTSRDELKASFLAAAKANNEDLTTFYNANEQFLSNVYSALLNRGVDNSGLEFWMNLLQNGVSRAEVVASIIEAINANPASEDYAIYNAKMGVANAVTAAFAGPKAGLNAEQSKALNDQLVAIMNSVTSPDVKATDESIKAAIDNTVGSYGKEAAPLTFKAVTENMEAYELGNAESTTAQTFKGTINLQNADKSTISNKATLNTSNFSDTLVVDVIPSTGSTAFDYTGNASQVKTFAEQAGIKNLTINNGTANIENLDSKGISGNLKITGAANVSGSVTEALQYLEVNTGGNANATATIAVNANLKEYLGKGSGKDNITVSGTSATVEKINTGAGDDTLDISGTSGAIVNIANATINLGAGNDTLHVRFANLSGANIDLGAGNDTIDIASILDPNYLKGATIDGGAGRDTMLVIGDTVKVPFDPNAVGLTLKNIEVLQAKGQGGNASKLAVSAINGQELTLTKNSPDNGTLELVATNKETNIDLSKLNTKVVGNEVALDKLTLSDVGSGTTSGVTVKLTAEDAKIAETITLASGAKKVEITNFVKGASGGGVAGGEGDHVKFASGSVASSISGDITNGGYLGVKSIKVSDKGFVTFYPEASGSGNAVTIDKIEDVQTILTKISGASTLDGNKVVAVNIKGDAYLINTGASRSLTTDDIVIKLVGVDASKGIQADQNYSVNVLA